MSWFIVFFAYMAQIETVRCSMDEVKSGEKLMTSLQRMQSNLHSIRSVITKHSNYYCSQTLNKTDVGWGDLQNCATHQNHVVREWAKAMSSTLFELRHFRRTLLKVAGAQKILSPYFLVKITAFIQDEENIMGDATRAATEICVNSKIKTHETKKIEQQLKKYGGHNKLTTTTESVTVTDTEKLPSPTAKFSASFNSDEWLVVTTVSTPKMDGPNEMEITTKNVKLISGQCQDKGGSSCRYRNNTDESVSTENAERSTVIGTTQFLTTDRPERMMIKPEEKSKKTKKHESSLKAQMSPKASEIHSTMTSSDVQLKGENYEWGWLQNWSIFDVNWSNYDRDDCNKKYAKANCNHGIMGTYEIDSNETLIEKEPRVLAGQLISDNQESVRCSNCSVASDSIFKRNLTSRFDMIDTQGGATSNRDETTPYWNSTTNQNTTQPAVSFGGSVTTSYTDEAEDYFQGGNCSNDDGEPCEGLDYSRVPLGKQSQIKVL